ncbi:hypothetical protein DPMN_065889 [Dreissena polymorpha]|uniref:Uncharacterized protein n=1 Tax=Dreissena polymorpha TaxID=45954 RepID=A0A9D4BSI5_DREPO|nr:hypothetical protein DPMN_065889 [Dreissena polymorpha]
MEQSPAIVERCVRTNAVYASTKGSPVANVCGHNDSAWLVWLVRRRSTPVWIQPTVLRNSSSMRQHMMSSGNQRWKTIHSLSYFRHKKPQMQTRRLFRIDQRKTLPLEPEKKGSSGPLV